MKNLLAAPLFLGFIFGTLFNTSLSWAGKATQDKRAFGAPIVKESPMMLGKVVGDYTKHKGKKILVTGKVKKVCEKKGCWMALQDGNTEVRTLFKDYGFFVPTTLMGQKVTVEGELIQKEISKSAARHFLKDEGASQAEINKIKGPQKVFQFIAEGVAINKNT